MPVKMAVSKFRKRAAHSVSQNTSESERVARRTMKISDGLIRRTAIMIRYAAMAAMGI